MLEFDELRVRVRRIGARRYLVVANGTANAATITRITDQPVRLRDEFNRLINIELGRAPSGNTDVASGLRSLGRSVFELLFGGDLRDCLRSARVRQHPNGLRLRFDLPPELQDLPVETMRSPSEHAEQTLGLNATLSVARSLPGDPPTYRLPTAADEPDFIRVLVAVASPRGLPAIESTAEIKALRRVLPELAVQTTVCPHATRRRIEAWLAQNNTHPSAVLLIAHGGYDTDRNEGVVLLEAEDGSPDRVPGHLLSGMLVGAQQLRLVVLNLCHGASSSRFEPFSGMAQALIGRGIPAVAGMNGLVTDRAAQTFGPQLFEGLCANKTVDESMTSARQHMANLPDHTTIEWSTPTLFLHELLGHSWLFKAREVREAGAEFPDPLRDGEAALGSYGKPGNVSLEVLLRAARYLRLSRDWDGVLRMVRTNNPGEQQSLLMGEASLELAWPGVERLCETLAGEDDPDAAAARLRDIADRLPTGLRRVFGEEIAEQRQLTERMAEARQAEDDGDWSVARAHYTWVLEQRPDGFADAASRLETVRQQDELAGHYADADAHRQAGRWAQAEAGYREVLSRSPNGFRDATAWADYTHGRGAEAAERWDEAIAAYDRCGTVGDGLARLAYARGRAAAATDGWPEAHREFTAALGLGADEDEWSRYAAARVAESAGQWESAAEGFARLADFSDSDDRRRFASGKHALTSGDWETAAALFEELAAAGSQLVPPLSEVRQALYADAVSAEELRDWAGAARRYGALPRDLLDVDSRSTYVDARIAEEAGEWSRAAEGYRATEHADAATRLCYVLGREAEAAGQWDKAHEHYLGLPIRLADAEARARYVSGCIADERGEWEAVISGFGELPDSFADGEVGRRRRFARAKLAERNADWTSVLGLLSEASHDERAGAVALTRLWARAQLAEEDGDWAGAVAVYASAGDGCADFVPARTYAAGRVAELDEDWAGALACYREIPEDSRDVAARRTYAQGRLYEQDGDWAKAIECYRELDSDFADAPTRSSYASLQLLVGEQAWESVSGLVEELGDYADASIIDCYARGRMAEENGDWSTAVAALTACGNFGDAADRGAFARGRQLEDSGQWSAAIALYQEAPKTMPAMRKRGERLKRLRAQLPWLESLAGATLVADPVALREETFPYLALRTAGVTPASTTEVVKDASFMLMESGGIGWRERVAWDRLRTPAKRLLVDARLYWCRDPATLAREIGALNPGTQATLLARLCERLPDDAALLTLLAGSRGEAIEAWRTRLATAPEDIATVHNLSVATLWQALELEDTGAWEQAERTWRVSLPCWAVLLTDDEYWIGWRQDRASCYGHAVTPADTAQLRAGLGRYLIELLGELAERHASAGRPQPAEQYRELADLFESEMDAARNLKEAGGLAPRASAEATLACGPSYLEMTGLTEEFGRFVARTDPADDESSEFRVVWQRLRWSFSQLSQAFYCLEHHRFDAALAALPDYYLRGRSAVPADCGSSRTAEHGAIADCAHCGEFLELNPAYTFLPDRTGRLLHDAVGLAVRARLSHARELLAVSDRLEAAIDELTAAVTVSANATMTLRTRQAVLWMVLGRAGALADNDWQRIERLDEAIGLLERAVPVVGRLGRERLDRKLADLLVDRGVWYGSGCRDFGVEPDFDRAVDELKAACRLDPESVRGRANLTRALLNRQDDRARYRTKASRLGVLHEAIIIVHGGLNQVPGNRRLLDCLNEVLDEVKSVNLADLGVAELARLVDTYGKDTDERPATLARRARSRRADGDLKGAVDDLIRAVRADPSDESMRAELLEVLEAVIIQSRNGKDPT